MNTMLRLQVGIDISRSSADFALLHPDGHPLKAHQSFSNSPLGAEKAKTILLEIVEKHHFTGIDIAIEATGYYWLPLFMHLQQDDALARYDLRLLVLNAKWVHWYKKSFAPDHKSDRQDPFYIAERMRTLPTPTWWEYDPHWLKLRFLTRFRFHLVKGLVREKNHYQLYLFLAHSAYGPKRPFAEVFSRINRTILHEPSLLEQLQHLSVEELAEKLAELSKNRLSDPMESAIRFQCVMQESFSLPEDIEVPVNFALNSMKTIIEGYQYQIQEIDREIARLVKNDYPEIAWLDSIPGVGQVFASGIAAEIGNLEQFSERPRWDKKRNCYRQRRLAEVEDAVAKFAGLWWPEHSSGNFLAEETSMSKRGNLYLRTYILQAADRMRLSIPSYSAYYSKKYAEATKHHHKRALVLTGRRAVGLFVGMLHHHEFYQPKEVSQPTYKRQLNNYWLPLSFRKKTKAFSKPWIS